MVDATITAVDRGSITADVNFMLEGHTMATEADPNPDATRITAPVYNLVVDHPEATFLWDTGSHPEAGDGHWPTPLYQAFPHRDADEHHLEDDLDAVGYGLDDVDAVVMSHLHLDHAGGLYNFAGTDVPVYVHEAELKHAYFSAKTDAGDGAYLAGDFDHDLNWQVVTRHRESLVEDVEFLHLPGHTPGLMGLRLDLAEDGTVILAGDEAYLRENYDDEHPLGPTLTWSTRDWWESLRLLKDLERRHDATVFCGHDPGDFERLQAGLR
ncbi:N-acyl homoserine lactonase family protein [Halobacteriaceae archaeon GCM10025711]